MTSATAAGSTTYSITEKSEHWGRPHTWTPDMFVLKHADNKSVKFDI